MSIASTTTSSRDALGDDVDRLAINTLRLLVADAVQSANSGHPGLPLGCAPAATGWHVIARDRDELVGLQRFGESGPGPQVAAHPGLTPVAIANAALTALGQTAS